jgi:hypothetical protein
MGKAKSETMDFLTTKEILIPGISLKTERIWSILFVLRYLFNFLRKYVPSTVPGTASTGGNFPVL